jgi:esterase/lipase superfamily enzyme
VLVYVHGFNTDYDEAAFRVVQVAADGGFRGTHVLFTWPSYRRVLAYGGDREVATASRDALDKLLTDIGRTPGVGRIHILAHSMGAFLTMEALRQVSIAGNGELGGRLGEVILAAPDLDVEVFRQQMARISRPSRISLFVQSDDRALAVSSTVAWDRQRVGALEGEGELRPPQEQRPSGQLDHRLVTKVCSSISPSTRPRISGATGKAVLLQEPAEHPIASIMMTP